MNNVPWSADAFSKGAIVKKDGRTGWYCGESEKEETRRYIEELEADIMPVDTLIAFAQSEQGAAYFGAETAAGIAAHAMEIKAAGALYCDCPACAAAAAILEKKAALLA